MNASSLSAFRDRLPLSRLLILILAGGFMGLMIDIRVEHVDVVRERSIAWLPIIYSGVMSIACLSAFIFWRKAARFFMVPLFLMALLVGGMGFYFHNDGRIIAVLKTSVSAWTDPTMNHTDAPPQFAPLAFAGLGVIGILACVDPSNAESVRRYQRNKKIAVPNFVES